MGGRLRRLCLTVFHSEAYLVSLYMSHLWQHMLVMLYSKTQTPLVQFVVYLSQICKTCRQQDKPV